MFKKLVVLLTVAVGFMVLSFSNSPVHAKENTEFVPQSPENFFEAIKNQENQFDLTKLEKQEETVYDEERNKIGVVGIEPAPVPTNDKSGLQRASYDLDFGYNYWKVYWYGLTVNFWYHTKIWTDRRDGHSEIVSVYDGDYAVTPPYNVTSDTLSIINKVETLYMPSESRYTLRMSSTYGGSWPIYLYAKTYQGTLTTGTN